MVKLQVRRSNLLEDSFTQIMSLQPHLFSKKLRIIFAGEPGIDAGGLLRYSSFVLTQPHFRLN